MGFGRRIRRCSPANDCGVFIYPSVRVCVLFCCCIWTCYGVRSHLLAEQLSYAMANVVIKYEQLFLTSALPSVPSWCIRPPHFRLPLIWTALETHGASCLLISDLGWYRVWRYYVCMQIINVQPCRCSTLKMTNLGHDQTMTCLLDMSILGHVQPRTLVS